MKLITPVVIMVLVLISCKKSWLEIKSDKKQKIPATLQDYQALLDDDFVMNNYGSPLGEIASDGHYIPEAAWPSATSIYAKNAYTWTKFLPYPGSLIYSRPYSRILINNIVLEGLEKNKSEEEVDIQNWNDIRGQALFNRAEAFYELSQIYAQPYSVVTASTDLGISLRLTTDITEKSTRSTVAETYIRMINDLKEAENLLPLTPIYPTRGSKPAANALLARIYLIMADYENALYYSDRSLSQYNELLDYSTVSSTKSSIGAFNNSTPINTEIVFFTRMYTSELSGFLTTNCLIDTSLFNQYSVNDLRRSRFFRVNSNGTISFKGNYNNNTSELFCGIATDETYLIRAECYARKGDVVLAMADLNKLLSKRFDSTFIPTAAASSNDALNKILNERKKELLLRGIRWSDLRRLNKEPSHEVTLTRIIGGSNYTITPNSYKYTFPLPDYIIELTGMFQSPGW